MTVSIVSPSAAAVKPRRHPRFRREDIPTPEIDPVLKAFGRHIARSFHRGRGVHIPAMKNTAFGQVLRTLELKRALTDEVSRPRGRQQTEGEHFMTLAAITMTARKPPALCRCTARPTHRMTTNCACMPCHVLTRRRIKVHDAGFRWAPKQALFVAPARTPGRKTCSSHLPERLRMKTARSLNVRKHGRSGLPDTAESGPVNPHRHLMKWKDWPR